MKKILALLTVQQLYLLLINNTIFATVKSAKIEIIKNEATF